MQRLFSYGIMAIAISALIFCKSVYTSTAINFLSGTDQIINVRVVGIGKNEEQAIINAEMMVFEALFFRGVPESKQKLPMIGSDEHDIKSRNKKYFNDFLDGRRYKTFLMSTVPVSGPFSVKGGKSITVDVKVNIMSLRTDLETFGIIRKFGV
jgi:hypothetical protein